MNHHTREHGPEVRLVVCQPPGSRLYAVVEDDRGDVYDPSARAFRPREIGARDPALELIEDGPSPGRGLFVLDLAAVAALEGGHSYTVYVTRDDVMVRVFTNLGGLVSSRDDWAVLA